jgi:hypothetical protein
MSFTPADIARINPTGRPLRFRAMLPEVSTVAALRGGLQTFAVGSQNYRTQVDYLEDIATRAILATQRALHHGAANVLNQVVHGEQLGRVPIDGFYRNNVADNVGSRLPRKSVSRSWVDASVRLAAGGIAAKGGACKHFTDCVITWCLMNACCRVSRISGRGTDPNHDHCWVILSLGSVSVVVDAWVPEPVVCFPSECSAWYRMEHSSSLIHRRSVDILRPAQDILEELLDLAVQDRRLVKAALMADQHALTSAEARDLGRRKGEIVTIKQHRSLESETHDRRTNLSRSSRTRLGHALDNRIVRADTRSLRGTGLDLNFGRR